MKTFYDAEAVVIGYEPGKGRIKGVCGALKCRMESGKEFKIGTGLSDAVRSNPPKIVLPPLPFSPRTYYLEFLNVCAKW